MLSSQLHDEIQAKIDQGDEFLNADDFTRAAETYREALALIPEPKHLHEISLPAFTALGEANFYAGNYPEALSAFREALEAPGGVENPLVLLRLGASTLAGFGNSPTHVLDIHVAGASEVLELISPPSGCCGPVSSSQGIEDRSTGRSAGRDCAPMPR